MFFPQHGQSKATSSMVTSPPFGLPMAHPPWSGADCYQWVRCCSGVAVGAVEVGIGHTHHRHGSPHQLRQDLFVIFTQESVQSTHLPPPKPPWPPPSHLIINHHPPPTIKYLPPLRPPSLLLLLPPCRRRSRRHLPCSAFRGDSDINCRPPRLLLSPCLPPDASLVAVAALVLPPPLSLRSLSPSPCLVTASTPPQPRLVTPVCRSHHKFKTSLVPSHPFSTCAAVPTAILPISLPLDASLTVPPSYHRMSGRHKKKQAASSAEGARLPPSKSSSQVFRSNPSSPRRKGNTRKRLGPSSPVHRSTGTTLPAASSVGTPVSRDFAEEPLTGRALNYRAPTFVPQGNKVSHASSASRDSAAAASKGAEFY